MGKARGATLIPQNSIATIDADCVSLRPMFCTSLLKLSCRRLGVIALACLSLAMSACGSGESATVTESVDDIFQDAMAAYQDEDWLDARRLFNVIRLQYPASQYADDAQYYLAEINFARKEYILAAFNYSSVYRSFPRSEFVQRAHYQEAMCYFRLSPSFNRDQSYTDQAISKFSEYQSYFPNDSLAQEASQRIEELREKLARREYETAVLYVKMRSLRSAIVYYDSVIDSYPDTPFLELAYVGKIRTLVELKNSDDARETIRLYRRNFPNGQLNDDVNDLEEDL